MKMRVLFSGVVFGLVMIAGCGGGVTELTEEQKITGVVSGLGDVASNPEALKAVFVSGPEKPGDYKNVNIEVASEPVVDGNSATVKVKVTTGMVDSSQGDSVKAVKKQTFEKEWTLEKVGDSWKLKSAPVTP